MCSPETLKSNYLRLWWDTKAPLWLEKALIHRRVSEHGSSALALIDVDSLAVDDMGIPRNAYLAHRVQALQDLVDITVDPDPVSGKLLCIQTAAAKFVRNAFKYDWSLDDPYQSSQDSDSPVSESDDVHEDSASTESVTKQTVEVSIYECARRDFFLLHGAFDDVPEAYRRHTDWRTACSESKTHVEPTKWASRPAPSVHVTQVFSAVQALIDKDARASLVLRVLCHFLDQTQPVVLESGTNLDDILARLENSREASARSGSASEASGNGAFGSGAPIQCDPNSCIDVCLPEGVLGFYQIKPVYDAVPEQDRSRSSWLNACTQIKRAVGEPHFVGTPRAMVRGTHIQAALRAIVSARSNVLARIRVTLASAPLLPGGSTQTQNAFDECNATVVWAATSEHTDLVYIGKGTGDSMDKVVAQCRRFYGPGTSVSVLQTSDAEATESRLIDTLGHVRIADNLFRKHQSVLDAFANAHTM